METQPEPSQKQFIKLAIPNILTNFTVPLAGLIDIALLGHLPDIAPLAGVALAGLLFDYAYWSFGFLRMATVGLIAKAFGAHDHLASSAIFFRGLLLAVILGGGLIVVQIPFANVGFAMLGGEADVEAAGKAYFFARIWGAPATLGGYVLVGWLLGRSRANDALVFAFSLNGMNVFLDWLFIFKFGWGAYGAGLATMYAEIFSFLVGSVLIYRAWKGLPGFSWAYFKDKAAFKDLMLLNANIMVRAFAMVTTFAIFTNFSALFGSVLLAANTILLRLLNTAAYFIDGFAYALESLAGRYAGANKWLAVKRSLNMALAWNLLAVGLFIVAFFFFDRDILGLLTTHEDVIQASLKFIPWVSGTLLLSGFAYIYDGFFIGLADGVSLRKSMLWASLVGFLPLALLSRYLAVPVYLWFAMFFFMVFRSGTLGWSSHKLFKQQLGEASVK